MYKLVRGKGSKQFGDVEWYLSVNWSNVAIALILACIGIFNEHILPVLQEHNVLSGAILGLLGALLPIIQNYLKDNTKISYEKPIDKKG